MLTPHRYRSFDPLDETTPSPIRDLVSPPRTRITRHSSPAEGIAPTPIRNRPYISNGSPPGHFTSPRRRSSHINAATSLRARIRVSEATFQHNQGISPPTLTFAGAYPIPIEFDPIRMTSRPGSAHRPTHIALPSSPFLRPGNSPTGGSSPLNTPQPLASPASPRSSFLPSFMRNRTRAATITGRGNVSPSVEVPNPLGGGGAASRHPSREQANGPGNLGVTRDGGGVTRSVSTPTTGGLANGAITVSAAPSLPPVMSSSTATPPPPLNTAAENPTSALTAIEPPAGGATAAAAATTSTVNGPNDKTYRIRLVPHLESTRSVAFDPVVRELFPITVPAGTNPSVAAASVTSKGPLINGKAPALLLKVGRYTEKTPRGDGAASSSAMPAGGGGDLTNNKVGFASKVVSRTHAEIWCEIGGKFFIRDTSSSSGTFLNHIRLSSPNTDSRPTPLNDGDVLQLGVDYQGGQEEMFRCVKMRVELGREWQRGANEFNTNALKQLKALGGGAVVDMKGKGTAGDTPRKTKTNVTDCCICLFSVTVCQSLFIAPCSHVFHYKCIRPLLMKHHPGFSCPLCRTFANLEEDVETEDAWEIASRRASVISRKPSNHSIRLPPEVPQFAPSQTAAAGQPSSGVGIGGAAASVDELLAGPADTTGGESGTASEEGDHVVNGDRPAINIDGDGEGDNTHTHNADNPAPASGRTSEDSSRPLETSVNLFAANPFGNNNADMDIQTPRNETFLSTLALGYPAPTIEQRIDIAETSGTNTLAGNSLPGGGGSAGGIESKIGGIRALHIGGGGAGEGGEGSASGSRRSSNQVHQLGVNGGNNANGNGVPRREDEAREDIEMMFS